MGFKQVVKMERSKNLLLFSPQTLIETSQISSLVAAHSLFPLSAAYLGEESWLEFINASLLCKRTLIA